MRILTVTLAAVLAGALLVGCQAAHESNSVARPSADAPGPVDFAELQAELSAAIQAADLAGPADPVATVDGKAIPRQRLVDLLVEAYGADMLKQLVALEVIRQAAQKKGHAVTPADIAAEENRSYPDELANMAPAERERLLDGYLARNGLTRVHWRLVIERNAWLRKISQNVQGPDDEQLRDLFRRSFGEKVRVRFLEVPTPAAMRQARERITAGEAFAEVAADLAAKSDAARTGVLPPFTRDASNVPEAIRGVAFTLKKPGEVSSPIIHRGYHLLQLIERIEPQDVKFDDVKEDMRRQVRDQAVRQRMNTLLRVLPEHADIKLLDPQIKEQIEAEERANSDRAAPGAAPQP